MRITVTYEVNGKDAKEHMLLDDLLPALRNGLNTANEFLAAEGKELRAEIVGVAHD